MTKPDSTKADTPHFETDEVETTLAIEQGLGIGARELAAQREPHERPHRGDILAESEQDNQAEEQLSSTNDA